MEPALRMRSAAARCANAALHPRTVRARTSGGGNSLRAAPPGSNGAAAESQVIKSNSERHSRHLVRRNSSRRKFYSAANPLHLNPRYFSPLKAIFAFHQTSPSY